MRVLLDTNILIHREAAVVVREGIGKLFYWLDQLGYHKYIHPVSRTEIAKHADERVRRSFAAKLDSYHLMRTTAPVTPEIQSTLKQDKTENAKNDSILLNELIAGRVDLLITEDRGIHDKAQHIGVQDRVFTIDSFLEKIVAENPDLIDYHILGVRKVLFGDINLTDDFFDTFRSDYAGFDKWFNRKSEEPAYVCFKNGNEIAAFLYLKVERNDEPYHDIFPRFEPKRRLKIGTLKVELNGYRLGERFLKIVFDNAVRQRVDEIYVTIFPKTIEQQRLILLLEDYGFQCHGVKRNPYGEEQVYVRDMTPCFEPEYPKRSFPYMSATSRIFLVPIYPKYHTELLPDSILTTESPDDFIELEPHRNAIQKAYVSRSYERNLRSGDIIVFYRTGGYYKSVATTLGIIDGVHLNIRDATHFIELCRKRSVFSDEELLEFWNYRPNNRPFIVNFLYAYSFPKRPNLKALIDSGVISDIHSAPRGFERISREKFKTILALSKSDSRLIVD